LERDPTQADAAPAGSGAAAHDSNVIEIATATRVGIRRARFICPLALSSLPMVAGGSTVRSVVWWVNSPYEFGLA
jgi:hypothetical protein